MSLPFLSTITCSDTSDCYTVANVGTVDNELDDSIIIFPNPTQSIVTLKINDNKKHSLKLISSIGTLIFETEVENDEVVQMEDLPTGLYYFLIDEIHFVKLMKQ